MATAQKSYDQILKSSSLIGGAQAITMLIGVVQTKFVAVFLGPLGFGLAGTLSTILAMGRRTSGLGISSSGVRDVAEAHGSADPERMGRTVLTLRRVCWLTGLLGASAVALLAEPLSQFTFGTGEHAGALRFLAAIILLQAISDGQMAYIQGIRRIADLARVRIAGALAGAVVAVSIYAWLGMEGIVPALLAMAACNLVISWLVARRHPAPKVDMSWRKSLGAAKGLVQLGVVFMWTGLLTTGVALLTRVMIAHEIDVASIGIFAAAFRMSGYLVSFVLNAMSSDFYPRLTAVADDDVAVNRLVNEQTEIGLLLVVPGLVFVISLASPIVQLLYTREFAPAAELLRWFILGCFGRVVSWPMGFILLAKAKSRYFAATETTAHLLHILLIWLGLQLMGLPGVAVAFAILYGIYVVLMVIVSHRVSGFRWSGAVWRLFAIAGPLIAGLFLVSWWLSPGMTAIIGVVLVAATGVVSLRELTALLDSDHKLMRFFGSLPLLGRLAIAGRRGAGTGDREAKPE